jgi:hypothetical protein
MKLTPIKVLRTEYQKGKFYSEATYFVKTPGLLAFNFVSQPGGGLANEIAMRQRVKLSQELANSPVTHFLLKLAKSAIVLTRRIF